MSKNIFNNPSNTRAFFTGSRDISMLVIAAVPFAIIYGALAVTAGLSEWLVMAMSIFVFAGASQFIAVTLFTSSAAYPVILLTVFIINLRHMLYAASLMPQIAKLPQWFRLPMGFLLTDEAFAVVSNRVIQTPSKRGFVAYYFGAGLTMYLSWIFFSWMGMTLGQNIPDIKSWGLDVAMAVAFVGIIVPILKKRADWACFLTASISALLTYDWPHQTGLLFSSLIAIAVGMLVSYIQHQTKEKKDV